MKTAEFVTPRHPDKMCDQISDTLLDWAISQDPKARVAIEAMGGHGKVYVVGELTMQGGDLFPTAVKMAVERITGRKDLAIEINVVQQSPEIAQGVDTGGAGDQGIMRGYAVRETEDLMPIEYVRARDLCKFLFDRYPYDGKTQVTTDDNGAMLAIVASFQNVDEYELKDAVEDWLMKIKKPFFSGCRILTNPAGNWSVGGFEADTGLTGRKLAVDNYGPRFPIGGGAFSGKDATKVDRSAAYMARRIAVEMLREYGGTRADVEIAYAIGVAEPVEAMCVVDNLRLDLLKMGKYDLRPAAIIDFLDLRAPQYENTAIWGHFGRKFNWDV